MMTDPRTRSPSRDTRGESLVESLVTLVILLGVVAAALYFLPRAADVYYKAGWMIAHWSDAEVFPPGSNVCAEPFCLRTDTTKKHVCGRPGYTSEFRFSYCGDHEPAWHVTDTRFDGPLIVVPYFAATMILSMVLAFVPMIVPVSLGVWVYRSIRRLGADQASSLSEATLNASLAGAFAIVLTVWVMNFWW